MGQPLGTETTTYSVIHGYLMVLSCQPNQCLKLNLWKVIISLNSKSKMNLELNRAWLRLSRSIHSRLMGSIRMSTSLYLMNQSQRSQLWMWTRRKHQLLHRGLILNSFRQELESELTSNQESHKQHSTILYWSTVTTKCLFRRSIKQ